MSSVFKFIIFTLFVSGIILIADQPTVAQSQKVNAVDTSIKPEQSSEQPPLAEVQISRRQTVINVVGSAAITICQLFNPCRKVLDIFRGILGNGQSPISPQLLNRPTQQPTGNKQKKSPF